MLAVVVKCCAGGNGLGLIFGHTPIDSHSCDTADAGTSRVLLKKVFILLPGLSANTIPARQ